MSGATWIRAGAVLAGGELLADHAVRIEDGVIAELRPGAEAPADAQHTPEGTLVPGFVEAHGHLSFGYAHDHETVRTRAEHAQPEALRVDIRRHAQEALRGGVTTLRDCGDRDFTSLAVRDEIARGDIPGPRVLASGPPVTTPGGHLNWCGGAVAEGSDVGAAVDRLHAEGADHVKVLASGGGMTAESDPHRPQFSKAQLDLLVARAAAHGMRVAAHAHSSDAIALCVEAGVHTLEHCSWKGPDGSIDLRLDVVDEIARRGISVVITMAGIHRALLPGWPHAAETRDALVGSATGELYGDFGWARTMLERGCDLVVASDAGVRFTPFTGFPDSIRCGIAALDISALRAIDMATAAAARAVGLPGEAGTIAPGRTADLVLLGGLLTPETRELPALAGVWSRGAAVPGI